MHVHPFRALALMTAGAFAGFVAAAAFVKRAVPSRGDAESDEIALVAVYDGIDLKSHAKAFREDRSSPGTAASSSTCPRRRSPRDVHLTVHALYGGVAIRVPPGCRIESNMHALMGGVDARAPEPESPDASTITLEGLAVFGASQWGQSAPRAAQRSTRPPDRAGLSA